MAAEAKPDATSVVLPGFWNPAILQPPWLAKVVYETDANMPVAHELSFLAGQPPRFTVEGIKWAPEYTKLTVNPAGIEEAQLHACEQRIRAALTALPHTPIRALGINFQFQDTEPTPGNLALFPGNEGLGETANLEFETTATAVVRAMAMEEYVLNFTRSLEPNNLVVYKFNFHYTITDAAAAADVLDGAMVGNLATARQIIAVYDAL